MISTHYYKTSKPFFIPCNVVIIHYWYLKFIVSVIDYVTNLYDEIYCRRNCVASPKRLTQWNLNHINSTLT